MGIVGFNDDARQRIREVVRTVEAGDSQPPLPRTAAVFGFGGLRVLVGKTNASHAKSANGTINVYRGQTKGSESFTAGDVITAWNRFAALGSGKWVVVLRFQGGWEIIAGEC